MIAKAKPPKIGKGEKKPQGIKIISPKIPNKNTQVFKEFQPNDQTIANTHPKRGKTATPAD